MKKILLTIFIILGVIIFAVPETEAEYCYNSPNRPIIGYAGVFFGDPPEPYLDVNLGPNDVARFSLEGTFPGDDTFRGPDCEGVIALFEVFVDGNPTNVVRSVAGRLLPGQIIQGGPMGSWQWYVDWPMNNRLFDGRYRFRAVALDGSPIIGVSSQNVLIITGAGPPPPLPTCSTNFSPTSIISGQTTAQSWTSTDDADGQVQYNCTGNLGSATVSSSGTQNVTPTASQTCTFTVVNTAGSASTCSANITVNQPPPPSCTASFSPVSIISGQTTTQSLSSSNDADGQAQYNCTGDLGSGAISANGSANRSPANTQTCTYTVISVTGVSATCSAIVTVTTPTPTPTPTPIPTPTPTPVITPTPTPVPQPPSCSISFSPSILTAGETTTESWSSANDADFDLQYNCTGDLGSGTFPGVGSILAIPSVTQSCTLTVINSAGTSANCSASVTVNPVITPTPSGGPSAQAFGGLSIPNPFGGQIDTFDDLLGVAISFLYYIAGPIVVIMIVIAGLLFLFARDDSSKVQTAKRLLLYAIIGLVIILIGNGFVVLLRSIIALGTP